MKLVFMGTPEFAAAALKSLFENDKTMVAAVVTQPDKPKGRGGGVKPSPVKELARSYSIKILQPL